MDLPANERLHSESDARFLLRFDLTSAQERPVRLEFSFDRAVLLARVDQGMAAVKEAMLWFSLAGGASIFLAFYRRAAMTDIAAELVHDLRNPLMALLANVKVLLLSPDQTREIAAELDRDIMTLNDKLNGFLKLTRSHDDSFETTDIGALVRDVGRLAGPV
ncbi:histidine kinase dimerization/phospho-acceptor domain-containing protein, partial [Thiolapillus sp.]|uniref:histidine kinase dimerization/phospho-acceptor domain-containing protein n=1 Tax=Thiolapillus sp. TaxID=2017437 RepID=UPI003AF8EDFF